MSMWLLFIHNLGGDTVFHWLNTVLHLLGGDKGPLGQVLREVIDAQGKDLSAVLPWF